MSALHEQYALGRSPQEYARLTRQAELLKPMTRRLFAEAGIEPGMRVVDLGSGAGDICILLSEIVGSGGSVIGLDVDEDALVHARERVSAAGVSNVTFVHSDFARYVPNAPVDAIVGRLVLMYQKDPAAALTKLTQHLRPGGVVAFLEPWFQSPSGPDSTMKIAITCIVETLRRSGAHVDLGPRLHRVFLAAGLPLPNMRFEMVVDPRQDSPLYDYIADTVAQLLPKAIEYGIPGADELDVSSIAGRLRTEMNAVGYAMMSSPLVSAWCSKTI
ncbi:MAG: class I SAM-dependent methyltransferase [Acidobacteriaceae bacterium]